LSWQTTQIIARQREALGRGEVHTELPRASLASRDCGRRFWLCCTRVQAGGTAGSGHRPRPSASVCTTASSTAEAGWAPRERRCRRRCEDRRKCLDGRQGTRNTCTAAF
jgi:hypothetical protein